MSAQANDRHSPPRTLLALGLGLALSGLAPVVFAVSPSLGFESGGIYASGFNTTLRGGRICDVQAPSDVDIRASLAEAKKQGCFTLVHWGYKEIKALQNGKGDIAAVRSALAVWLKRQDPTLIDAMTFCEELYYDAAPINDALYDEVKAHSSIPVYVWPTSPLGPTGMGGTEGRAMPKADGWMFDFYEIRYSEARAKFLEFIRTGKPLILCVSASPERMLGGSLASVRDQTTLAMELNLPVVYWAADPQHESAGQWYYQRLAELIPWRHQTLSALACQQVWKTTTSTGRRQAVWSDPVEIGCDATGRVDLVWQGIGPAFTPDIGNFTETPSGIFHVSGPAASFEYQFWSRCKAHGIAFTLRTSAPAYSFTVSVCRTGMEAWREIASVSPAVPGALRYELGNFAADRPGDYEAEFRVRVVARPGVHDTDVAIEGCRVDGTLQLPESKAVRLLPAGGVLIHTLDLSTGIWRALGSVTGEGALDPAVGVPRLRGSQAQIDLVFASPSPLNDLAVRLSGRVAMLALGGNSKLGVSRLGGSVVWAAPMPAIKTGGWQPIKLVLDFKDKPEWQGVTNFTVHLLLSNGSGAYRNPSAELERLTVDARTDGP